MNCLKKTILKSFILGVALAASFNFALAQQQPAAEGITISPPLKDITVNPGEVNEQKIQITNPTNNLIELYPSVMNFQSSGEGGEPKFYPASDESSKFSLAHWIKFTQTKVVLTPQQVVEFAYTITVPQDAEPGGHYGVVFLATQPPTSDTQVSQVSIASMVGSLVLLRVPGDIVERGNLDEFSAPWFYFKPPVPFATFFSNKGNIHFKPEGEITIRNWQGKEVDRININPTNGNILPDSRRNFEVKWAAPAAPFWKIPVGRFSADLRAVYGQSDQTLGSKIYFWIIPWWVIIAALIALLIIIIFLIRFRKKRKKKKAEKKNDPPTSANSFQPEMRSETPSVSTPNPKQDDFVRPPRRYV
jgi:hypothetical protein